MRRSVHIAAAAAASLIAFGTISVLTFAAPAGAAGSDQLVAAEGEILPEVEPTIVVPTRGQPSSPGVPTVGVPVSSNAPPSIAPPSSSPPASRPTPGVPTSAVPTSAAPSSRPPTNGPTSGAPTTGVASSGVPPTSRPAPTSASLPTLPATLPTGTGQLVSESGRTTFAPGERVVVTGTGFAPNSPVVIGLYSTPLVLGTTTANGSGAIRATVTMPGDRPGDHTLVAFGRAPNGTAHCLLLPITITGGAGGASGGDGSGLPTTGQSLVTIGSVGLLVLLTGIALRLISRRRTLSGETAR